MSIAEDVVTSDEIGTESSSSKNDGVLDANVVVDIDLLKEQIHNNKREDEVHNDEEEVHKDEEEVHNDEEEVHNNEDEVHKDKEEVHKDEEDEDHKDEEDKVHKDEEDEVHKDEENDPIPNLTEIMANHLKTEFNDNA